MAGKQIKDEYSAPYSFATTEVEYGGQTNKG